MTKELVIKGSREKFVWLLVIGSCLLIVSYWALVEQHMWVLGGLGTAFWAFGLFVIVLMMRPGNSYLRLYEDGFETVAMKRRYRYAWTDVDEFFMIQIGSNDAVGIKFSASCQQQRIGRAFAEGLTGVEGAIPNLYAMPPADICRTLKEWKSAHSGL